MLGLLVSLYLLVALFVFLVAVLSNDEYAPLGWWQRLGEGFVFGTLWGAWALALLGMWLITPRRK